MGGFQNQSLNEDFKQRFCDIINTALIKACKLIVEDCIKHHSFIQNHEEKLRTHLLENYLEDTAARSILGLENVPIRFQPEVSVNYNSETNTYIGRTDIGVFSSNWLSNRKDYYIIECKRIDGTSSLYQKYVDEGICRFIGDTPKYPSYNNRNIMLGFIVENIDIAIVISAITDIHTKKIKSFIVKDITLLENSDDYCLCESTYTNRLSLNHIFYNVSEAVSS